MCLLRELEKTIIIIIIIIDMNIRLSNKYEKKKTDGDKYYEQ